MRCVMTSEASGAEIKILVINGEFVLEVNSVFLQVTIDVIRGVS